MKMTPASSDTSTRTPSARALPHMPQLDGLRAIAVAAVLLQHYFDCWKLPVGLRTLHYGDLGVHLFFVLSGFLITGILLQARDAADAASQSRWVVLKQFYIRRFLRIFPLYYFVIAVTVAINFHPGRAILPWLLTYTTNIKMALQGDWVGWFSHFWTLAVEEQFYLLWPWVVLFAPRTWLIPITSAMVASGPLYRAFAVFHHFNTFATDYLTIACSDSLGMGALLALASHREDLRPTMDRYLKWVALPLGLGLTAFLEIWIARQDTSRTFTILFHFVAALLFCWVVRTASLRFKGIPGRMLESQPLTYIGKISYGVYVLHLFMTPFFMSVLKKWGVTYLEKGAMTLMVSGAASLVIASLSWHFFEQPINNLKRYFNYLPVPSKREAAGFALGACEVSRP